MIEEIRQSGSLPKTERDFLTCLLNTKRPRIFAESEVRGDGSDWTLAELQLLGDNCIAVPVTVYDNGLHAGPLVYEQPSQATPICAVGGWVAAQRSGPGAGRLGGAHNR